MNKEYEKLILEFAKKGYEISGEQANEIYKQQKKDQDSILSLIAKIMLSYTILDSVLKIGENDRNRLKKDFNNKISLIAKEQYKQEKDTITNILEGAVTGKYYSTGYVMNLGINFKLQKINDEEIKKIVNKKIDDKIWCDRLWNNKKALEEELRDQVENFLKSKTNVNQIEKAIKNKFNQNAFNTHRLVQTEVAKCQSAANDLFAAKHGIKQQMFCATLDLKTSKKCRSYDGEVFDIDDNAKPIPPLHPFCRSCLINVPYDNWRPTERKDNISKEIINYKTYDEWLKDRLKGSNSKELDKIKDFKEPLAKRHNLNSITSKSIPKDKNTIIMSDVDVKKDIEDIKKGLYNKVNGTYVINGRTYGYHDSRFYPIEGEGFVTLDRGQYKALQYLIKNGNNDKAITIFRNMKISEEKINEVMKIWEVRNK